MNLLQIKLSDLRHKKNVVALMFNTIRPLMAFLLLRK